MRTFDVTATLASFLLMVVWIPLDLEIAAGLALLAGIAFPLLFSNRTILAFDSGGVMVHGDFFTEVQKLDPKMFELVRNLKRDHKVLLLTNQNEIAMGAMNRHYGFDKIFDGQVVSGKIGAKKPDPRYFDYVTRKFHVHPRDLVFVDDTAENVDSAKKLGIRAIRFENYPKLVNDLRHQGIAV